MDEEAVLCRVNNQKSDLGMRDFGCFSDSGTVVSAPGDTGKEGTEITGNRYRKWLPRPYRAMHYSVSFGYDEMIIVNVKERIPNK